MSCKARKREIRKAKAQKGAAWREAIPPTPAQARRHGGLAMALLAMVPFLR